MSMPASEPTARLRKWHHKLRTGCDTCKFKRVKCGEERPICTRCRTHRFACIYSPPKPNKPRNQSYQPLIPQIGPTISSFNFDVDDGAQYFEIFRSRTSFKILSHSPEIESLRLIFLQAGTSESSIRHAIAALGALEKTAEAGPRTFQYDDHWSESNRHLQKALKLYSRAITHLKSEASQGQRDLRKMLLTCLLAFCFEAWTGNQELALNQIYTGVNLIREWKTKTANSSTSPSSMSPAEDELSRVFSGLAIQFITFTTAALLPAWDCLGKDGREHLPQMPANFVSLREAGMYEHIIMRYGMQLVVDKIVKPVLQSKEKLFPHGITSKEELRKGATEFDIVLGHIKQWWKAFEELSKVLYGKGGNIMVSAIILNLHITTLYLVLVGISGGDETAYDDYYELFGKTVELAEIVLKAEVEKSTGFYFSVGVVVSLQFTAQKCRCTSIRRKAIALLLGTARREGVWDSLLFGKMMEWGADVEEQFMKNGQVPGWARIPGIKRNADLRQRTATLICQQRKSELSDEMVTRRKVIHW